MQSPDQDRQERLDQERRLSPKGREAAKNRLWRQHQDRWVILFTDLDTKLRFALCRVIQRTNGTRETLLQSIKGRAVAQQVVDNPRFREFWLAYPCEVVSYESLKEFPDHHQRQHWRFNSCVMFFGSEREIDWIASLTVGRRGFTLDPATGLEIPTKALGAAAPVKQ